MSLVKDEPNTQFTFEQLFFRAFSVAFSIHHGSKSIASTETAPFMEARIASTPVPQPISKILFPSKLSLNAKSNII